MTNQKRTTYMPIGHLNKNIENELRNYKDLRFAMADVTGSVIGSMFDILFCTAIRTPRDYYRENIADSKQYSGYYNSQRRLSPDTMIMMAKDILNNIEVINTEAMFKSQIDITKELRQMSIEENNLRSERMRHMIPTLQQCSDAELYYNTITGLDEHVDVAFIDGGPISNLFIEGTYIAYSKPYDYSESFERINPEMESILSKIYSKQVRLQGVKLDEYSLDTAAGTVVSKTCRGYYVHNILSPIIDSVTGKYNTYQLLYNNGYNTPSRDDLTSPIPDLEEFGASPFHNARIQEKYPVKWEIWGKNFDISIAEIFDKDAAYDWIKKQHYVQLEKYIR